MKNIFLIFSFHLLLALWGCTSQKEHALNQIKILSIQLDSLDAMYQNINWKHWSELSDTINTNSSIIGEHYDMALKLDPNLRTYFNPYSTAGKVLSRIMRKSKNEIENDLLFSKQQLANLSKHIEAKLIHDTDSISIYIGQEHHANEELIFKVTTLEETMNHQQEVYDVTYKQVNALSLKLKSINPAIGKVSKEIHYDENQEQD